VVARGGWLLEREGYCTVSSVMYNPGANVQLSFVLVNQIDDDVVIPNVPLF
jgi:hypothetical protein